MATPRLGSFTLLALLALALAFAPAVSGQAPPGNYSEEDAQAIDRMIMCPVCPAETIDQAQVEVSRQMREQVRELLAEGRSRDEVLDFFRERYGTDIIAAPPKSGFNLLVWILPIVGVAAGLAGVYLVVRSMTKRTQPAVVAAPTTDPDLLLYLQIVDRHLAARPATGPKTTATDAQQESEQHG